MPEFRKAAAFVVCFLVLSQACGKKQKTQSANKSSHNFQLTKHQNQLNTPPVIKCPKDTGGDVDAYEKGMSLLEAARIGEHYKKNEFEKAKGLLLSAAKSGHLDAQFAYGRHVFSTRIQKSEPKQTNASQREDFVSSIAFLRVSALRGHRRAKHFFDGVMAPSPQTEEPPLSLVPKAWVQQAWNRSDTLITCWHQ